MKRNFTLLATATKLLGIALLLCLALTCPSERAAAQPLKGTVSGKGTLDPGGQTMSSDTPLGWSPGPGHGTGPNNWAMCGLLSLAGDFDNSTVAQIVVRNDIYMVHRQWTASKSGPVVGWTCVRVAELKKVPPISNWAGASEPPPVTAPATGSLVKKNIGDAQDACIWAGLAGGLSETPKGQGSANFVTAQVDQAVLGQTLDWAQSTSGVTLSSFAWCSSYKSSLSWTYVNPSTIPGVVGTATKVSLPPPPPLKGPLARDTYWSTWMELGPLEGALALSWVILVPAALTLQT